MSRKKRTKAANMFALLAVALAALAVAIAVRCRDSGARVLSVPQEAGQAAVAVMDAVCGGDFETAGKKMYGRPDLGVDRQADSAAGQLIWDAFVESLSYELKGSCYFRGDELCQDVVIRSLDLSSVTRKLDQRTQDLLNVYVEDAEDTSHIYDENNEYLESFVQATLQDAVRQAIQEDARYSEQELTLTLIYSAGEWWVMPDQSLLNAISGGIAG